MSDALRAPLPTAGEVRYATPAGRLVLLTAVLGSGMAMIDGSALNVALPTIGRHLHEHFAGLQWTVNAYALSLAGLLLLGGSLGDRFGRRRVFTLGIAWFAIASMLCGLAPDASLLIAARALQGIGAALLVPGSLAIIESTFAEGDRSAAVGAWSGLGAVAAAIGPVLGGWLSGYSWRYVFYINAPIAAVAIVVALRAVPESRDTSVTGRLDLPGPVLAALGLAGLTWSLTEGPIDGWSSAAVIVPLLVGVASLVALLFVERLAAQPMLPLRIFSSRQFSAANLTTFAVYAALGGGIFLLPIALQRAAGYSPLEAGASLVPLTVVMLLFSARSGRLAQRIGPRLPMTIGPIVAGVGLVLFGRIGHGASYISDVLPAVLVFSIGLVITVAPLTATVLSAAGPEHAGIASAINNEVARVGGLLAVAVLPAAAGISSVARLTPAAFSHGYRIAVLIAGLVCAVGGLLSYLYIRNNVGAVPPSNPTAGDPTTPPVVEPA